MQASKWMCRILGLSLGVLLLGGSAGAAQRVPGDVSFLTGPQSGTAMEIARTYLREHRADYGLAESDIADLVVSSSYVSKDTGVTHIYLQQRHQGIEVFNGITSINVARDGSVINVGNRFTSGLAAKLGAQSASLAAADAVAAAAGHLGLAAPQGLSELRAAKRPGMEALLSDGGIAQAPIAAKLVIEPQAKTGVRLSWNVVIHQKDGQHWWNVRVDAQTGEVLAKNDWVAQEDYTPPTPAADGSSYQVFEIPFESPNHSGTPSPGDGRTTVAQPAESVASPFGWHDTNGAAGAESTLTIGNNVRAYLDVTTDNTADIPADFPADGGAGLDFLTPLNLTLAPSNYRPAAVANLFYWNNLMHDVSYLYGFDEPAGSFQFNNYGRGGLGSDAVEAQAQDGGGINNANFGTPPDGSAPQMQMFLWNQTTPQRDGDFDNGVIAHEYGHGISNRLTGGPATTSCLGNTEQMGEGWSDWQGLIMTMKASDTGPAARGIGTYVLGQPITGAGIRAFPYSTNMATDPRTYADTSSAAVPHGVGSIWTAMLWEMNWALIGVYGFEPNLYDNDLNDAAFGNVLAHRLVMDGMKLQPCSPGFVDGRNAILQADLNLTGGTNQCLIWGAFAKRGLGFSATQGSSNSNADNSEAFDLPPGCLTGLVTPPSQTVCAGTSAVFSVDLGTSFTTPPITLGVSGVPAPGTSGFSPNPVTGNAPPNDHSVLTIGTTGVATGSSLITVSGTDAAPNNFSFAGVTLNVLNGAPLAPSLTAPANGATAVPSSPSPTLTWAASAGAASYDLEVATDAGFTTIIYSAAGLTGTSNSGATLASNTTYFWRVSANNACGAGLDSATFSFTTAPLAGDCPIGITPNVFYTEGFEASDGGWTHGGTGDTWTRNSTDPHGGTQSFFAVNPASTSDQRLISPAIAIPSVGFPITLNFWNSQAFETPNGDGRCWDAGILEVSTTGPAGTFTRVSTGFHSDPYDAVIWNDQPGNNPIAAQYGAVTAWCPNPPPQPFLLSQVDLAPYAGQTVNFRFRLGSDAAAGNTGWSIDDVTVQNCPGTPVELMDLSIE